MTSEIPVYNPATEEIIARVPMMSRETIREIIGRTYDASSEVMAIPAYKRSKLLKEVARALRDQSDELARLLTAEIGRPIRSTKLIIERTASIYELAAQEISHVFSGEFVPLDLYDYPPGNENRIAFVVREPVGLVGAITPFNFPPDSMAHKVAPALAAGNSVVIKPSSYAPLTITRIVNIIKQTGFPQDAINVVTGDAKEIGDEFVDNPKVSLITFTGSSSVGLSLAGRAVAQGKKVIMELGGSDAMIVLEDADLSRAAQAAIIGRFDYAGQFCNATKRLLVRDEVFDKFVGMLADMAFNLRVGDPLREDVDLGPLISRDAVKLMDLFVKDALDKGGKVLFRYKEVPSKGFYYPPTIIEATRDARVLREEVFGPVLPVVRIKDDEDAVRVANSVEYGLDASIFTRDFARAYRLASKIKAGSVFINDTTRLRFDNLPFGGYKKSGIGRESVRDTMREMTETKVIIQSLINH